MTQESTWPVMTIDRFPKEWMGAFTTAVYDNDVGVVIFEEHQVNDQYVRLVIGVRSPFDLIMAGYWFGNFDVTQAVNGVMPEVMGNVQKLITKFTSPSES